MASLLLRNVAQRSMGQAVRINGGANGISKAAFNVRFLTRFTKSHEYVITDGNVATIGITDFAAQALGDIVYVDLPEVDEEFEKGESFGSVESVKAASDVYAPIGGTVVETNEALADAPEIINESPEDKGWFMKIKIDNADELDELMDADAYKTFIVD